MWVGTETLTLSLQSLSQRSNCCRSRKCIRWHIPMHASFAFFIYFSYLFYLGHLSLLGLQIKIRRQSNSSTFCLFKSHNPETFMSSAAIAFVHAVCKRSQKCLAQKVVCFGSLGWIPMIQVPFNSSCVALQYKTGTKFFNGAVPELYGIKNQKISVQLCGIFHIFSRFYRVSDLLTIQEGLVALITKLQNSREEASSSR